MSKLTITKPAYAPVFAGLGFHDSEAGMYRLIPEKSFSERIAKCYREISPGFMRCFFGFSDQTKEVMDDFADCYERMQKITDTPIYMTPGRGKLHSSDADMKLYAEDVAARLEYLVKERDVRHIAYYCFSNELSQLTNGALRKDLPLFKRYHELLYDAFQRHGLNIGLLATDASMDWSSIDWAMANMNPITKDYCGHWYEHGDAYDTGFYQSFCERCREYTLKAAAKEKHFILGEVGISGANTAGVGASVRDACTYFDSGDYKGLSLMTAEMIAAAVNAGVFAIMSWTFCDYPDPMNGPTFADEYSRNYTKYEPFLGGGVNIRYNKWGMLKWEDDDTFTARPHYFALGNIFRYMKRNSKIMEVVSDDELVRACAVMTRKGRLSVLVINRSTDEKRLELELPKRSDFRVYLTDTNNIRTNEFADLPRYDFMLGDSLTMPPESIAVITDDFDPEERHIEAELIEGDTLSWKPVTDPRHSYYRIYDGERQIGSTVAERFDARGGNYRVVSVDRDGEE